MWIVSLLLLLPVVSAAAASAGMYELLLFVTQ